MADSEAVTETEPKPRDYRRNLPPGPGPGRPKGSLDKITREIRALANPYGPEAIKVLAKLMRDKRAGGATRVAACREILDRAYGKAPQSVDFNASGDIRIILATLTGTIEQPTARTINGHANEASNETNGEG